jgi:hypothetical protein
VGPRAGLDAVENRHMFCPCRESKSDSSVVQPIPWSIYRLSYSEKRHKIKFVRV